MDRRRFLSAVTAAVGGFALDRERLLWVPGQRTYFDIRRVRRVEVSHVMISSFSRVPPYSLLAERMILWREVLA